MITPRLRSCSECSDIPKMIGYIDCKIANVSGDLYNNLVFILNRPIHAAVLIDLLMYKRILQYKYVNSDYASGYTVEQIANKVNILKFK